MYATQGTLAGRVSRFKDRWFHLGVSLPLEVANVLTRGLRIPWKRRPPPLCNRKRTYNMQRGEREGVSAVVKEYLQVGAIKEVPATTPLFLSAVFGRPKPGVNKWRMITDLTQLNFYVNATHFKMEGIPTALKVIQEGDFMCKIDVHHAYFHIPIAQAHRPWMAFQWEGKTYRWEAMCFGLNVAPRVWTKVFKVVIKLARRWGIRCVFYIDDLLVFGRTKQECTLNTATVAALIMHLGYEVEWKKTDLEPKQEVTFLGMVLNSQHMTIRVGEDKLRATQAEADRLLNSKVVSARRLQAFAGKVCSLRWGLPPAYLYTMHMNQAVQRAVKAGNWESPVTMTSELRADLHWWKRLAHASNGDRIRPKAPDLVLTSDASDTAWGATLTPRWALPVGASLKEVAPTGPQTWRAHGSWTETELHTKKSNNWLEMEGGVRALRVWGKEVEGKTVLWQTDNATTHWDVTKWKSRSPELNRTLRLLFTWTRLRHVSLTTVHVAGTTNVEADRLSRTRESTDWQLHPVLFKKVMHLTMWCKVDCFATTANHLLPRFWSLHWEEGAESVNFFAQTLGHQKLWMNPPFNLVARVLEEVARQKARGVILVPVWECFLSYLYKDSRQMILCLSTTQFNPDMTHMSVKNTKAGAPALPTMSFAKQFFLKFRFLL